MTEHESGVQNGLQAEGGPQRTLGPWRKNTGWGGEMGSFWRGNHGLRRLRKETTCREDLLEHSSSDMCQCWSHMGEDTVTIRSSVVLMCTCLRVCSLKPLPKVLGEFCCWG